MPTQTNLTDTIEILLKAALNFEVTDNKLFVHWCLDLKVGTYEPAYPRHAHISNDFERMSV